MSPLPGLRKFDGGSGSRGCTPGYMNAAPTGLRFRSADHSRASRVNPRVPRYFPRAPRVDPRASRYFPRASRVNPRASRYLPRASRVNPRVSGYLPRASRVNPRMPRYFPRASRVDPRASRYFPRASRVNPRVAQYFPRASRETSLGARGSSSTGRGFPLHSAGRIANWPSRAAMPSMLPEKEHLPVPLVLAEGHHAHPGDGERLTSSEGSTPAPDWSTPCAAGRTRRDFSRFRS